ncbi:hypothetical protein BGX23_006871 [Mortierella sp. AD031]|nr:hypothetical protein BGX23_006871 [Mortierella sp. AD031]KAG0207095.1 hypothetical protein BGX33_007030 [Mortierella sp. NVP41]
MSPLLLPELLSLIAGYLARPEQQRCSRVCWTWNGFFSSLVWKTCSIDYDRHTRSPIPTSALHTYARHIRVLSFQGFVSVDHFAIPCTRLETLKIVDGSRVGFRGFDDTIAGQVWSSLALLVSNNPNLSTIELSEIDKTPPAVFWEAIGANPGVKQMNLDQVRINYEQVHAFWEACSGLEVLTLIRCRIVSHPSGALPIVLPAFFRRLQQLSIENLLQPLPAQQVELLRHCPQLNSFYWRGGPIHGLARDTLLNILGSGRLPNLDSFDIMGMNLDDLDMEHIIQSMSRVKKLAVYQTNFGPSSLQALQPHFKTIEELNLLQCPFVTSADVALLLRSCPELRVFKAEAILSDDIRDGEIWPCHEYLHTLALYFDLTLASAVTDCQRTFACLSKLKALRRLNVSRYLTPHGRPIQGNLQSLQFRLDHGLAQLATLRHLEALYFDGTPQQMKMDEARWMENNWKALRVVRGTFNSDDRAANKEIANFFKTTFSGHVPLPTH